MQPTQARRPLVLIAVMMAMFMAAIESTIVATAMPTIIADLGGFELLSWVFSAYLLTQAVTTPIYGRLADIYGRKRIFTFGAGLFLVGSALCGFATGMVPLILFRALQGLGAGAIMPIAITVIGDIYTPAERAKIQGWLASVWGVSAIVGPALGAFLVETGHWPLVFWVNLPIGVVAVAMLQLFLTEKVGPREHPVDYLGSVLLMLGTGALMFALVQADRLGGGAIAGLVALALLSFVVLVRHEGRVPQPMMPLGLWRNRVIVVGNLACLVTSIVMMGIIVFLPAYVQGVMGRSARIGGLVLTAMLLGWPIAATSAARIMLRISYRSTAAAGGVMLLAGNLVLILLEPGRGPAWAAAGAFLVGIGMGLSSVVFVTAVQNAVDWSQRGVATSSTMFMRMVGQSLGAACLGAIFNVGIETRAPGMGHLVDRLMDPAQRQGLAAVDVARLSDASALALHDVYRVAVLLAAIALAIILAMPARLNAVRPAAAE